MTTNNTAITIFSTTRNATLDDSQYDKPWVMDCGAPVHSDTEYEAHAEDCEECAEARRGELDHEWLEDRCPSHLWWE